MTDDTHGTTHREMMYKSMEKPAGEWKPLNRRQSDRWWFQVGAMMMTLALSVGAWFLFNWVESFLRHRP